MGLKNNIPAKKYSLPKDIIAPFRMAYQSHPGRKLVLLAKHFEALNKMMVCRTSTLGGAMFVCLGCAQVFFVNRSCKHRFCVTCGIQDTAAPNLCNIVH